MTHRDSELDVPPSIPPPSNDPSWYKDAIIYQVHIKAFCDSNGDGMGDIPGLISKLGYLESLGVTAIWLLPFYPSPLRDDGYDIADYTSIHPDYGTLADFKRLLREAHARGMRVITELVLNHTSDQHPWFQRARKAKPGSVARDFYVWSDTQDKYAEARIIFQDFEHSNWSWDNQAGQYYFHRFYHHQPDLNFELPQVHDALLKVLDFWFDMGVDGMRLDAVPYLYEREGTNCENLPETYAFLKKLRAHLDAKYADKMLLAEANQWPEDAAAYFGEGDGCHMAFHFPLMPRMFMALQMEDRHPIVDILQHTPQIPKTAQWAIFLRNHDELTLEMVTDEERDYMYRVFAEDPRARINVGIRRRLAPLMGNDRRKIELLNLLLLTLPGSPVIYYGDELGMGDNYYLGDRNGVRTPMQWSANKNAGFSSANPQRLYLPVIIDPEYHYEAINVETAELGPASLLSWTRRFIGMRKRYRAFGRGSMRILQPDNGKVLAFIREHENESVLVIANLSRHPQMVRLDLRDYGGTRPREVISKNRFAEIEHDSHYPVTLGPHGYYLFDLGDRARERISDPPPLELRSHKHWHDILEDTKLKARLEREVIPAYLAAQDWFGRPPPTEVKILTSSAVARGKDSARVFAVELRFAEGPTELYALPLAFRCGDESSSGRAHVLCSLWLAEGPGLLVDAFFEPDFCGDLVRRAASKTGPRSGELFARSSRTLRRIELGPEPSARIEHRHARLGHFQYADKLMVTLCRLTEEGTHPDVELAEALSSPQARVSPLLGKIHLNADERAPIVAFVQAQAPHEGTARDYARDAARRYVEELGAAEVELSPPPVPRLPCEALSALPPSDRRRVPVADVERFERLGAAMADMHLVLEKQTEPSLQPEPMSALHRRSLLQAMQTRLRRNLRALDKAKASYPEALAREIDELLPLEQGLETCLSGLLHRDLDVLRMRVHGHYRLGALLCTGQDMLLVDYSGAPFERLSERRIKRSVLSDVTSLLRSVHRAAQWAVGPRGGAAPRLIPWAEHWYANMACALFQSYRARLVGSRLLPSDDALLTGMLEAYLLNATLLEVERRMDVPEELLFSLRALRALHPKTYAN
jgi:maltose alpha-D-glucosyltransferase/alpha-amylase